MRLKRGSSVSRVIYGWERLRVGTLRALFATRRSTARGVCGPSLATYIYLEAVMIATIFNVPVWLYVIRFNG